jgi:hypothetical protein
MIFLSSSAAGKPDSRSDGDDPLSLSGGNDRMMASVSAMMSLEICAVRC